MSKKITAFAALVLLLLTQHPQAQGGPAQGRIFFVDVGTGAATLIVSPTGKSLLVDGGPPGSGTKISNLMATLGITTIDYTVLTHYHIDHMGGLIELLNGGKVAGTAFDNGDDAGVQPPGTSTAPNSTRGTYLNYVAATGHAGVTRQTAVPADGIDLGGGMRATFMAAGGRLASGGSVAITTSDLNSESISTLIELGNFDYLVSGDLTGGGSTSTAKTPDVETYVGQMVGDLDVVQLDHHGSTTANNQVFLAAVKAEVAFAQTGENNTFGHPNRETVNKYLNTAASNDNTYAGTGVPPSGVGPVFYQNEASPSGDDRVTQQGYTGAAAGNAGQGTIVLETDGTTTYSLKSFDDFGARINPAAHTYAVDGLSPGVTTDFPPTVIAETTPVAPRASESVLVSAAVNDRESPITGVVLTYALDGAIQPPAPMTFTAGVYQATIPSQLDGTRVEFAISGTTGPQTTTFTSGYFSGTTSVATLRALNALGEPLYKGFAARIQGTVTAGSNTFASGTNDDYIQDATGGINVFRSTDTPTPFSSTTPGQVAEAVGRIAFNGGRQRLDVTESVEKTTSPFGIAVQSTGPAPAPAAVSIGALNANPESFEGQLVSIANSHIVSGTLPVTPQPFDTFVTISDGTGSFALKVDHDTDVEGFNPGTTFTVVGIIQQDDFLRPFSAGYDIAPRSRADLGGSASGATLISIADARIDAINNVDGTPGTDFVPDLVNQLVKVRGAVTSIDFRGGNGIEYYIQDATGGIDVFNSTQNFGPFSVGDSVEAVGLVTHFNGLTEITASSVSGLPPGTVAAATPQLVTLSQLADGGVGEALEGRLIRIDNVTITTGTFPATNASGNVTISDATGSAAMRIDSDTNIDGTPTPGGTFSVVGVLGQFDTASPFDSGYQLFPRSLADISVSGASAITATPTSFDFGAVTVGGSSFTTITVTNASGSSVTLTTPFTLAGANADQFSVSAPGTTTLPSGASTTVSVTFQPTTTGAKSATLNAASSGGSAVVALTGTGQAAAGAGTAVVISEFRFRGPSGGNDEFVEIYNNTSTAIDVGGWKMNGSNNAGTVSTRATIPAGTMLPARRHYLFVNNGAAGYSGAVTGNQTYGTGITDDGGVALLKPDNTIADQVGLSTGSAYKEGTNLASLGASNLNRGYERKLGGVNGSQQDTNDNSADFQLLTPSDPQNLASAPTPGIGVSPTSINFGSVVAGGAVSVNVTITNLSATASVTLTTPFTLGGANPGSFSVGAPGAATLGPNATTTASVTFQPPGSGSHSATLTVSTTGNGSVNLGLIGTATGGITVDPTSIDFGTQSIGAIVGATVTISAATPVTLTPPFVISGANASQFFVGSPSTTSIDLGSDATVAVGFQPTSVGPKSASLLITSVNGGSRTVALTANVACPAITILGSLPVGIVGAGYSQTLAATGGTEPYTFTVSGGGLPPGLGLTSTGTVLGTPTMAGSYPVSIRATDANGCSGESSFTIAIVAATLTAAPASFNFGVVPVGSPASTSVTITNTSGFTVTLVTPFTITGSSQFSAGSPATTTLAAGASTTVPVSFAPAAAGAATATVSVTSSSGGSTSVSLSGTGRQASVTSAIVISEFRFRGPAGANDEFVELYNSSDAPVVVGGFLLRGSNSAGTVSTRATVTAGATIAARGHYLFANAAAGASLTGIADQTYGVGFTDDAGVAIVQGDGTVLDQVGLSAGSAYGEGAPLASLGTANADRSYERKLGGDNGSSVDTNDNASDFQPIAPSAPQNLSSPITPALAVSPASIDFGSTARGSTASAPVTITNTATAPLTLTPPFAITGADAAEFSIGAPGTTALAAAGTTTATVTFHPTTLGSKIASLLVTSIGGGSRTVALSGMGVCAAITVSGDLPVGEFGSPYVHTITAAGGTGPYTFSVSAGALPDGVLLDSSGSLSGTAIAVGLSSFTIVATAVDGCAGTADFVVAIVDTTAPALTLPADVTIEATGATTVVSFTTAATDLLDGIVAVNCAPASGSAFPVATTTVNCSATDAHGNSANGSFTVTVTDHTAPALTLPANISATATTPSGAVVTFSASASDAVDGSRPVTCAPASGSTFPIGTTTVSCSTVDAHANAASGSFTVTVTAAAQPGRMTAAATIDAGAVRHEVAFLVQERATGADAGALLYVVKTSQPGRDQIDVFETLTITSVSFFNVPGVSPGSPPPSGIDTALFAGAGTWNGRSGYTFEAVATDAGEPGRDRDSFAITVRDSAGHVVGTVNAKITSGNIQSLRSNR